MGNLIHGSQVRQARTWKHNNSFTAWRATDHSPGATTTSKGSKLDRSVIVARFWRCLVDALLLQSYHVILAGNFAEVEIYSGAVLRSGMTLYHTTHSGSLHNHSTNPRSVYMINFGACPSNQPQAQRSPWPRVYINSSVGC